jgi:hypothetical protein
MNFNMFVQIRSLSEAEVAVRNRTDVGPLICMNSQMIKEIVPFSKPFIASLMITFENFDMSFRARVLISKDTKLFCIRHVLFYLNRP